MARRTQSKPRKLGVDATGTANRRKPRTHAITTLDADDLTRIAAIDANAKVTLATVRQRGKRRVAMVTYIDPSRIK